MEIKKGQEVAVKITSSNFYFINTISKYCRRKGWETSSIMGGTIELFVAIQPWEFAEEVCAHLSEYTSRLPKTTCSVC